MSNAIEIVTPPGRIVWGHPMKAGVKTDPKTRKPILRDGKEVTVWSFGLAIPNAQFQPVEQAIAQAAYAMYPQGNFPRDFAWKIKRENDLDAQNKPYREREGYTGHTVISISTEAFCPPVFKFENGSYRQLDEKEFKTGDWLVANLSIAPHAGGVYINPKGFVLVGYDKEIVGASAINPNQVFGGQNYQLPPGVSATPITSAPAGVAPPYAGQPAPMTAPSPYAVPGQPTAAPAPTAAPQGYPPQGQQFQAHHAAAPAPAAAYPPPAHDFVNNAGMPAAPGYPAPAAAPPPAQYGAPGGIPAAGMPAGYPVGGMPGIPPGR